MRCYFGHDHPPEKLVAATWNPTQPWGPRPYHCPTCPEANKPDKVPSNWLDYPTPEDATRAGHDRACDICFIGLKQQESPPFCSICGQEGRHPIHEVMEDDLGRKGHATASDEEEEKIVPTWENVVRKIEDNRA